MRGIHDCYARDHKVPAAAQPSKHRHRVVGRLWFPYGRSPSWTMVSSQ